MRTEGLVRTDEFPLQRFVAAQDEDGAYARALAELSAGRKTTHCSRLRACARALLFHQGLAAESILGPIDALKLRSSMTLFARADPTDVLFPAVLERYFDGVPDRETERRL